MVYQDNRLITLNSQDGEKVNGTYLSNINLILVDYYKMIKI